jgi:hypothetical protein
MDDLEEQAQAAALRTICATLSDPRRLAEQLAEARAAATAELAAAQADLSVSLRHSASDLLRAGEALQDASKGGLYLSIVLCTLRYVC